MSTNEEIIEILLSELVKVIFIAVFLISLAKKYKKTVVTSIIKHCWSHLTFYISGVNNDLFFYPKSFFNKFSANNKPVLKYCMFWCKSLKRTS